jgi:hypothetical protein
MGRRRPVGQPLASAGWHIQVSTRRRISFVICLLPSLAACNMLISETAMFSNDDRARILPQDGIWLSQEKDCEVDGALPESAWPDCALWVVVRESGTDILVMDGKGQSESIGGLVATGDPLILQGRWTDTAKSPHRSFYGFYGIDPQKIDQDGRLLAVSVWPIECGTQSGANEGIKPFPGIGSDCHAPSKDAIRAAARLSRRPGQIRQWQWLRREAPRY